MSSDSGGTEIDLGICTLRFAVAMDDFARWELEQKEWCSVEIEIGGDRRQIEVISIVRLEQEVRDAWRGRRPAVIEDTTLVLERVDFDTVVAAVRQYAEYEVGKSSGQG